ncbi:molybdate ABC transporter substrate-binding protein [Mucilaginibacter sp.]|jgi:molybdate transport system substrate-binding protein|uniref:molybdate ABC transporter substrate-binding protein n=1 Tax=Mucilaginibacter sp. TaxID=1882438 RepID=UPI002BE5D6FB|nr:molybdate ABC transporter substrate-binding protein [Mucilaginibacter sp.]HTI57652.1 molybdate ABC transporter substrate-binding protein [Mucilaginibacter sp.]
MKKTISISISVILLCLLFSVHAIAQGLKVAVAANLQGVIKVLQKDFKEKTGIEIQPIVGSSGNLSAQIKNGAPFDVFLSADITFPETLYKEGFAAKEPAVYAYGSLIICSTQDIGFENWERELLSPRVKKIAIANPKIAPYGKAAEEALKKKGILDDVQSKIVSGESIAQVNTYITTGVVDAGFTTQALVKDLEGKKKLYWKAIDPKTYEPIKQGMVLIKTSKETINAEKFYQYMTSPEAKKILKEYGYGV